MRDTNRGYDERRKEARHSRDMNEEGKEGTERHDEWSGCERRIKGR